MTKSFLKPLTSTFHFLVGALFAVLDLFIFLVYMIGLFLMEIYGLMETFFRNHRPFQKTR